MGQPRLSILKVAKVEPALGKSFISGSGGGSGAATGAIIAHNGNTSNGVKTYLAVGGLPQGSPEGALGELQTRYRSPRAGTIKNLFIEVKINELTGPCPITVRVDGQPTSVAMTVPSGGTGFFQNVIDTVLINVGALISVEADGTNMVFGTGTDYRLSASYEIA